MKISNEKLLENFYKHNKINVAIFTDVFFPTLGGATYVIDNIAQELQKNNNTNVVVITGNTKKYKDDFTYPVIRCASIKVPKKFGEYFCLPNLDFKLKTLIKKLNIDVIHIHTMFGLCSYALKLGKKYNIPTIIHGHSIFSEEYETLIKNKFICNIAIKRSYKTLNKCDFCMPVSNITLQNYIKNNVKTKMQVVENATNFELTNLKIAKDYIKKKFKLNVDFNNLLISASRLNIKYKNLDFLFKSLKILKDKQVDFKLLLVGTGEDLETLKKLSEKLNLQNNIIFIGEIKNKLILSYFYRISKILVFPSVKDSCGLLKFEAATQKTPTLAIENTGVSEGITNNFNGFLTKNIETDYANKLCEILNDDKLINDVSFNAYKTLTPNWKNTTAKIIGIYKELIKNKKQQ